MSSYSTGWTGRWVDGPQAFHCLAPGDLFRLLSLGSFFCPRMSVSSFFLGVYLDRNFL